VAQPKRVEREGPKKENLDGFGQGAVASGRKTLAAVGVPDEARKLPPSGREAAA